VSNVWVAMSGGVDSSVAAARLVREGHQVTGVTMQLLPEGEDPGSCCSTDAVRTARRVCDLLGIDHYTLNLRDAFEEIVVEPFVAAYAAGCTPNPCIVCNDRLKFSLLLARACTHGADALATGHYARIVEDPDGIRWLHRGRDGSKEQSYFLYRLAEPAIERVLFPLGESTKSEVRAEAAGLGLPSAARPESQEVCFVPADAGSFVAGRAPRAGVKGPILDDAGLRIGTHRGIAYYTVGQRKGIGLAGGPWYVSEIRPADNTIVVSAGTPAPVTRIDLSDPVWRVGPTGRVEVVVRYRSSPMPARVSRSDVGLHVDLEGTIGRVAPGQAVVCYVGDRVVGGGVVSTTE
jgi:tRNA-uridine 2-sulfurtransferase